VTRIDGGERRREEEEEDLLKELDEASKQLHHKVVNVARTVMN
jgi:hypothetical protein